MREVFTRFFTLEALNVIPEIYWALAFIWVGLVLVAFFSIFSQKLHPVLKTLWALIVAGLPLAGMSAWCIFCLFRADYSYLKQFGFFNRR